MIKHPLPNWYKTISLLELQMKALQEDLPRNLKNKKGDFKDLESFDMLITAMRGKLNRAFKELKLLNNMEKLISKNWLACKDELPELGKFKFLIPKFKAKNMKTIITTDKTKFLQSERDWFPSMTNKEYKKHMHNDAESCEDCGVYYWKNCDKRCKCK